MSMCNLLVPHAHENYQASGLGMFSKGFVVIGIEFTTYTF